MLRTKARRAVLDYSPHRYFYPEIGRDNVLTGSPVRAGYAEDVVVELLSHGRRRSLVRASAGYAWTDTDTLTLLRD